MTVKGAEGKLFDLRGHLTPQQIEDLQDGWHVAITLGPSDLDVMHAGLTLDYHDGATRQLWDDICKQMAEQRLLRKIAKDLV